MDFFLGFDGGGTKTDCVLIDREGRILAESRAGPSNPGRAGFTKACASLGEAAQRALAFARVDPDLVSSVCAGLAGAARPHATRRVTIFLERVFPKAAVRVTTDLEIALAAAVGSGEGIVLVAGTGSAAFGRNHEGRTVRAGGLGPKMGDEGSAYDIGRRAIEAVARAQRQQGPPTILAETILPALEAPDWNTLSERIAQAPYLVFPRVFPLVAEAAQAGDGPSQEILQTAAEALAGLARSVAETLGLAGVEFLLAKSGGIFGRSALLDKAVDAQVRAFAPLVRIEPLRVSPAFAAAQRARLESANG
jgi:N-acetylglucosamine kinase-like BadF-type ATPase